MLSIHLIARNHFLLLVVLTLWIHKVKSQSSENPAFWQAPRSFNSISALQDDQTNMRVAISQDFQSIHVGNDSRNQIRRLVVDYSDSCRSTNTTIESLEQLNHNNLRWGMIPRTPTIALIRRGKCNWSEKIQVAHDISTSNDMRLSAILIYNNETTNPGSYQLYNRDDLSQSFVYKDSLPSSRNISYMNDNDLMSSISTLPMPIYFAPASYANQFIQYISKNSNENADTKVFWQLTPLLMPLSSTTGSGNPGNDGENGGGSPFSRGYLSYVIALAAIFLVALFAGVIFLRWWRVRQMRDQREYEAQLTQHALNMQMRMQAKPLPVNIVNSIPISKYTSETVKNANCAICLEDYEEDKNEVRILGCGHGFCVLCIDPWLTQKSTMCPICKWDCLPPELQNQEHIDSEATLSSPGHQTISIPVTTATTTTEGQQPSTLVTTQQQQSIPSSSSTQPAGTTAATAAVTVTTESNNTENEDTVPSTSRDTTVTVEPQERSLVSATNNNDMDRQNTEDHMITNQNNINNNAPTTTTSAIQDEPKTTSNEEHSSSSSRKNSIENQQRPDHH